jgi:transcriptional regulator with XRE-family HTH domain
MAANLEESQMGKHESFADVLTALRHGRGLSQSRLAARAGFDHSFIGRLENGSRQPTRRAVRTIADALDASPPERDRLLLAAGFRPVDNRHLFDGEPALAALIGILADQATPAPIADGLRRELRRLGLRYGRIVAA